MKVKTLDRAHYTGLTLVDNSNRVYKKTIHIYKLCKGLIYLFCEVYCFSCTCVFCLSIYGKL